MTIPGRTERKTHPMAGGRLEEERECLVEAPVTPLKRRSG